MISIGEMRKKIDEYCDERKGCENCVHKNNEFCTKYFCANAPDEVVIKWYALFFPNDPVNHPSHYAKGKIEVADFIADQKLNFDRGNAVKYVCRAGSKDPEKEVQDLEKAIWYINHEIKMLKGDIENGTEKEE